MNAAASSYWRLPTYQQTISFDVRIERGPRPDIAHPKLALQVRRDVLLLGVDRSSMISSASIVLQVRSRRCSSW